MSDQQISNPWMVLDQVGERLREGFGTTKLGTAKLESDEVPAQQSVRRGVDAELLTALLQNHALLATKELERQS